MKKHYTDKELAELQVEKEIGMKLAGIKRFNDINDKAIADGTGSDAKWNRRIMQELVLPMSQAINVYLAYYKGRPGKPAKTLTYLKSLPSREAAYITIKNVLDSLTRETEAGTMAKIVGSRIEDQVRFSNLHDNAPNFIKKVENSLRKANNQQYKHRQAVYANAEGSIKSGNKKKDIDPKPELAWRNWPEQDVCQLGAKLIDIFAENVLFEGQSVIKKENTKTSKGGRTTEKAYIAPTEHISGWVDRYREVMQELSPAFAPCVVPPRDWKTPTVGGYHIDEIARTLPMVKCRKSQLIRLTQRQMPKVYSAVNHLQKVPWQVSDKVYDTVQQCMQLNLDIGIPSREPYQIPDAPIPERYRHLRGKLLKAVLSEDEWNAFVFWKREVTKLYKMDKERKADYLKLIRAMGVASQYKEFENIYFVYTMDFRGRVYCRSDSFSPQGDDLSRGLIKFARGHELGKSGYKWLAVQGAGVWGEDKIPFEERVKFIQDKTEEIRDFAADPIAHTGWAAADKPWQFLNWCFEWSELQDWIEEGNSVEDFVSYIPCAMDGSCSGIQHYSAILRDPVAGAAVNLVPDTKPHDIYADVARVAQADFTDLTETGEDEDTKAGSSGWLTIDGGFSRNITKKPTMTLTYGSTQINCLEKTGEYLTDLQIKEDKKAKAEQREAKPVHLFSNGAGDEGVFIFDAVKLGSRVLWRSIGKVVIGPKVGMRFIQQVAWKVAKAGFHLEWTTPTGFIVEQHEYDYESRRVKTQLMGQTYITLKCDSSKINERKTKTSAAPNFIHSCDASHLIFTVDASRIEGIDDLAVIHDDFGTHAGKTDLLRSILSDTFVDMYTEYDVLQDFIDECEALILEEIPMKVPESMGLDLEIVRGSEYLFG